MRRQWKRKLAVILSAAMVLSTGNIGSLYASEGGAEEMIVGFEELENRYARQTLPAGAGETDIGFPMELWVDLALEDARGKEAEDEDVNVEKATRSDAAEEPGKATRSNAAAVKNAGVNDDGEDGEADFEDAFEIDLENDLETDMKSSRRTKIQAMGWILNAEESTQQEFGSDMAGIYVYEPVIPSGYKVDAEADLPRIVVEIEAGTAGKEAVTGMRDGILTITAKKGNGTGWSWNGAKLDVNSSFAGCRQIIFDPGINPEIKINRGSITITPEDGQPAISVSGNLTITSTQKGVGDGKLTVKGAIEAENVAVTGTAKVAADGIELFHIESGNTLRLGLEGNGALTGENGGSIYLGEGAVVEGMAGVLSDQGKAFTENGEVTVAAEDMPAADNQLTAGSYVGLGRIFTKEGINDTAATEMKDGILTVMAPKGSGTGWGWNGATLNINGDLKGCRQIIFDAGIEPKIQVNRGNVILTPDDGQPAIRVSEGLTITSTQEAAANGRLTVKGFIEATDVMITGTAKVTADGKELFHLESGDTLKLNLEGSGTLTGENGGSIYLSEGAAVEGMAGLLSDHGKEFTENGTVTVVPEGAPPADNQLTAGSYVGAGSIFIKGASSVLPSTGLKDGILTITKDKGGVKEEGWNWNGGRLDLNDKFAGNKQIVFASVAAPVIKINRGITMEPDAGKPAITASGDLTITADADFKLAAGGAIEAKSVTIKGGVKAEVRAEGSHAALLAKNGAIIIGDTAAVMADGAVEASKDIIIDGSASVVTRADRSSAAMQAKSGAIIIGGTATVIAGNQSGAAMAPAPDTSGYTKLRIAASGDADGRPAEEYRADRIGSYRYLKIEKRLSLDEIEESVEKIGSNAAPALVDALADQIRGLPADDRSRLRPETIGQVDLLLQEAANIRPVPVIEVPSGLSKNKQIQNAGIRGALLAADITSADGKDTQLVLKVVQKEPEKGAVLTFSCDLLVDGSSVELKVPVEVTVELPPEFYPVNGYRIHHVGDGLDEWLDFIYHGADNTTQFRAGSLSTFSIVNTSPSSGGGSGSGGSGGGGGGGGGSRSPAGAAAPGKETGRWIQDAVGWWYQNADKSYPKDGWAQIRHAGKDEWYFFDKNGYMVTGWVLVNGNWYYLSTSPDGTAGIMLTGWQTIDGRRYYFSEAADGSIGVKLTDIWIGEYYLDKDGIAQTGRRKNV